MRKNVYLFWALGGILAFPQAAHGLASNPWVLETLSGFDFRSIGDGQQGFYVVWPHSLENGQYTLLGQHFSPSGDGLWAKPGIPLVSQTDAATRQWDAFPNGKGGLVVTWIGGEHVRVQSFNAQGKALWPKDRDLLTLAATQQEFPAGVGDGAGGALIVWGEERIAPRNLIYAQHVSVDGERLWGIEGLRVSARPSDQIKVHIVADGQSGCILTWRDVKGDSSQVQAERLGADGGRLWGDEGIVVTAPGGSIDVPTSLWALGDGSAVFGFDASDPTGKRYKLLVIDRQGHLTWDTTAGEATSLAPSNQWHPNLYATPAGDIWVAWEDDRKNNWQVFVRRLRVSEIQPWSAEVPLAAINGDQTDATLSSDGREGVFVAWVDNRRGTPRIYAQEVDQAGTFRLEQDALMITDKLVDPMKPQLVNLSAGRAAVLWVDQKTKGQWSLSWQTLLGPT